jgi:hypothetical protein
MVYLPKTMSANHNARTNEGYRRTLPEAARPYMFKPGKSGNPGGKGGEYQRCVSLCREKSYDSAMAIMQLARETDDDRLRFMAHSWVYERAWGKPKDYDPKLDADPNRPKFDPTMLSPDQLAFVEQALRLMMAATLAPIPEPVEGETVIEAEPEVLQDAPEAEAEG